MDTRVMDQMVEALLNMQPYLGRMQAFLAESATIVQGMQRCSSEEAEHILEDLRTQGRIAFAFTLRGELAPSPRSIPQGRWGWYVPHAPCD